MAAASVPLTDRAERRGHASARIFASLPDGCRTTVHVAAFELDRVDVRLVLMRRATTLPSWCASAGVTDAIVGGFFVRPSGRPLGEVRTRGVQRRSEPFAEPWGALRACVHVEGGSPHLLRRPELGAAPRGDLLQAGPLLLAGGASLVRPGEDPEGFSAGSDQFDSDITRGRHPRAALGIGQGSLWAVACDGRSDRDAGMTLAELADFMRSLGAESAINLDGGGSTSLVVGGRMVNRPRDHHGAAPHSGRPIRTALAFSPRR